MMIQPPRNVSVINSTTTPLAAGETWTSAGEIVGFNDFAVSGISDVEGTLYVDFSNDGVNWDSVFPVSGFDVRPSISFFHVGRKLGRWMRLRLVNGPDPQTYVRVFTYYEDVIGPPSAPLRQTLGADADAITVRPLADFEFEIVAGSSTGWNPVEKFGEALGIDATSNPVDVADALTAGQYTGQPQGTPAAVAETVDIVSTSTADASAGTGMQTIVVQGLDENGEFQSVTYTLNGTTPVTTAELWYRIWRVYGATAGSAGTNVGAITIRHTTTTTNIFTTMRVGYGQSELAVFTVPVDRYAVLRRRLSGVSNNNASVQEARIALAHRAYSASGNGCWRIRRPYPIATGIGSQPDQMQTGIRLGPLDDNKARVMFATASGLNVNAQFDVTWF